MIANPSFEGITRPGGWTRQTHTGQEWGEIFVPEGWTAFWDTSLGRPEMHVIQNIAPFLDPPRIRSGDWALKFFTMWRIHDAGIYQQVSVPAGKLTLSVWGHAWSSQQDDAHHSTLDTEDDRRNFTFRVGIDPTGATDPWGPTVVWGAGAHIYDVYAQVPEATVTLAQPGMITVFIRSQVLWAFKHCDAYIDDVKLEVIEPPPSECRGKPREQYERTYHVWPPWATPEERRAVAQYCADNQKTGGPSFDDAGIGDLNCRYAILHYIPTNRHPEFLAWFAEWYPNVEVSFADTPDVPPIAPIKIWRQCDAPWGSMPIGGTAITMCQSGCAVVSCASIGSQVQANTDPKILLTWLNSNGGFTDDARLYWSKVAEYYDFAFNGYHLWRDPGQVADMNIVRAALARGPVIIQVDYHPATTPLDSHFVVALREIGNDLEIADPWTGTIRLLSQSYWLGSVAASIKALVDYRIGDPPTPPPPPPPPPVTPIRPVGTRGTISLHWTPTTSAGIQNFLQTIIPPAAQVVTTGGGGPQLAQIRAWSPSTLLVYRRVENGLDRYNPAHAAPFVQRYIQDLTGSFNLSDFSKPPIYLVSINEIYECGATANNIAAANWDIAFMTAVEATGLNLRAVVYTAPVGNPHANAADLEPLLPMVAKACAGKHLLGKHCYYASVADQPNFYQESWIWYGGRFAQDDAYFVSKGYRPYWFLSEAGACGATIIYPGMASFSIADILPAPQGREWPHQAQSIRRDDQGNITTIEPLAALDDAAGVSLSAALSADPIVILNPAAGWKSSGDIQRYRREIVWCEAWNAAWNDANGGRLLDAATFTNGGWGWESYNLIAGDLDMVTAGLAAVL